jgi:hypothetical protein
MTSLLVALAIMFVVVGGSARWAVRAERRRNSGEEGHARDHR